MMLSPRVGPADRKCPSLLRAATIRPIIAPGAPSAMDHTDSAMYLVPNTHGRKTFVRRAHPPPTTAPLDDDFDAYTIPATSMVGSQWVRDSRAPSISAYDGLGYERTFGGAVEVVVRAPSRYGTVRSERTETPRTIENRARSMLGSGMGSGASSAAGRGYGVRHGSERSKAMQSESDGRWESLGRGVRQPKIVGVARGGGVASGGRKNGHERTRMVEHKILEDTPERTISIWREEVANSSTSAASTLAGEGEVDEFGRRSELDSHAHRRRPSKGAKGGSWLSKEHRNGYPNGKLDDGTATSRSGLGLSHVTRPPPFRGVSDPLPPVTLAQSTIYTLKSPIAQTARVPVYVPSPQKSNGYPMQGSFASSTPRAVNQRPRNLRRPSDATTVKATSTSSVETLLAASRPPLLHLMPVLKQLGITQKDHLRAIGQMSDAVRNSEVKDAALAKGVTIVDWAMLIDLARRT